MVKSVIVDHESASFENAKLVLKYLKTFVAFFLDSNEIQKSYKQTRDIKDRYSRFLLESVFQKKNFVSDLSLFAYFCCFSNLSKKKCA